MNPVAEKTACVPVCLIQIFLILSRVVLVVVDKMKALWRTAAIGGAIVLCSCAHPGGGSSGNNLRGAEAFVSSFYTRVYNRTTLLSGDITAWKPYLSEKLYQQLVTLRQVADGLDRNRYHLALTESFYNTDFFYLSNVPPDTLRVLSARSHGDLIEVPITLKWPSGEVAPDKTKIAVFVKQREDGPGFQIEDVAFEKATDVQTLQELLAARIKALRSAQPDY